LSSVLHIGQKIKEVWKRSGLKGTEFAQKLHRQRQSIYHLFKQESIDTRLLRKISEVLNHDFFGDYSKELRAKPTEQEIQDHDSIKKLSGLINQLSEEVNRLAQTQHKTRS
jgi:transcriptional regulator with XRE-family HTH domain